MAIVVVDVALKPEILDPQGQAIANALPRMGFSLNPISSQDLDIQCFLSHFLGISNLTLASLIFKFSIFILMLLTRFELVLLP